MRVVTSLFDDCEGELKCGGWGEDILYIPSQVSVCFLRQSGQEIREISGLNGSTFTTSAQKRTEITKSVLPMSSFCFLNTFDPLSTQNHSDLMEAFKYFKGKLPSRREIKELSLKIGISQSRIRRWFLEKSSRKIEDFEPINGYDERKIVRRIEERLDGLERRLNDLQDTVNYTKKMVEALSLFTPI